MVKLLLPHIRKLLILAILLCNTFLLAQEEQENTLRWFKGGEVDIDFSFQTDLFCGVGSFADNGCATLFPNASSIHWNPAQLVFLSQRQLMMDVLPPLSLYVSHYYEIDSQVQSTIAETFMDYKVADSEISYPSVVPVLYHRGGIQSLALSLPMQQMIKDCAVGFSYNRALDVQLNLISNGLSTLLETRKDVGSQDMIVKFRADFDGNLQLQNRVSRYSLSFAKSWSSKWSTGITVDHYIGDIYIDGKFMIDGIMETAGNEYAFNDPYDSHINFEQGEQNNLNQSIYTFFEGNGWGLKLGGLYRLSDRFVVGSMLELGPKMIFKGDMEVIQNVIPALNTDVLLGDSDEDTEILNPADLDLAKLTLTEPYENPTDNRCVVKFPSSFNLGLAYRLGPVTGNLNVSAYWSEFSYHTLETTLGIKLKYAIRSGFDFKYIQLGLGIIALDEIREESDSENDALSNILIPQFSVGFGFHINQNWQTKTLLFLAPTPMVKQGIIFNF